MTGLCISSHLILWADIISRKSVAEWRLMSYDCQGTKVGFELSWLEVMVWSFQCLTTGEGDFRLGYLTRCRAILPKNKEWIRVHFRMQEKVKVPFSLMAHKPWTRRDFKACLWFRRNIQRCRHFCKVIFLASNQNGVSLLLLMLFSFCVLLTDWHLLSC